MATTQTGALRVQGHDFQGNPIEELKTVPDQLSLFQGGFSPGTSGSMELYDSMPVYFGSPKEMEAMRQGNGGQFLKTLERNFVHRGQAFGLTIRPARIAVSGEGEREFYPTKREFLIGQSLRKLAINPLNGIYLGGEFAVQFSLCELRREMERTGHGISYANLIQGLQVSNATRTTLKAKDGTMEINAAIFPVLMLANRQQWQENPKETKCYVKFHPLVTLSVEEFSYRSFNYEKMMELDRLLSFYLFNRMSHLYVNADLFTPYTIGLNTLLRDSGTVFSASPSDNLKRVRRTLKEFKDKGVILNWTEQIERGPNNRIDDAKFSLMPTPGFIDDIIKANLQQQQLRELAQKTIGISSPN